MKVKKLNQADAKTTITKQGYWDRLQHAESWIQRAGNLKEWDDFHGPFIFYWIALNALYGPHLDFRGRRKQT